MLAVVSVRRDFGEVDLFQQLVPDVLAFPVAAATQLGSLWFVTLVLYWVYRRYDRQEALVTWGVLMGGTACWRAIKTAYPTPRPQQPFAEPAEFSLLVGRLYDFFVIDTGAGFPSGHAVTTAIVYLSLARILPVSTRRRRIGAAVGIIAGVGATRITLGVHHAVDVVAGAMLGHGVVLCASLVLARSGADRVRTALLFGIALTTVNFLVTVIVEGVSVQELLLVTIPATVLLWWHGVSHDWQFERVAIRRAVWKAAIGGVACLQLVAALTVSGAHLLLPV